jgi:hypothetical protein
MGVHAVVRIASRDRHLGDVTDRNCRIQVQFRPHGCAGIPEVVEQPDAAGNTAHLRVVRQWEA